MTGASRPSPRMRIPEPERLLFALISDFLRRRGLHRTADAMNMETEQDWTMSFMQATQHIPALGQTQAGFLADWFIVFWDLYMNRVQYRRPSSVNQQTSVSVPSGVNGGNGGNQGVNNGSNNNNQDKRQLIQRFMSVIGLGNRDPGTLSEEERQYLMSMVQRYSSQPLAVSSPHPNTMQTSNPAKRHRADGAPTGVSMPGQPHHGPIGTFTPQFPPPPHSHSALPSTMSPPLYPSQQQQHPIYPASSHNPPSLQSLPSDPVAMDRMMANMLSSVIGGTLLPMSPNNQQQQQQQTKVPQKRPASQPTAATAKTTPTIPPSPNTSRPASTTEHAPTSLYSPDFGTHALHMITPLSMTPPPQPFMDDMESIMLSSGGSTKSDKQEYTLQPIRTLYSSGNGTRVTAIGHWKQHVFVGRKDGRLSMVRVDSGQELFSCQPHSMAVSKIVHFNDYIVSSGHDRILVGHQLCNGKLTESFRLQARQSPIHSIVALDSRLLSCDSEGHLMLWEGNQGGDMQLVQSAATKQVGPNTLYQMAKSDDGSHIAVSIGEEVWIVKSDDLKVAIKIHVKVPVSSVLFAHGLLVCTGASVCLVYDPQENYNLRHTSPSLPDKICSCAILPIEQGLLAVLGSYQRAFLWTVGTNTIAQQPIHDGIVACVEPYRDGMVLTAGHDGVVWLLRVEMVGEPAGSTEQDDLDLVLQSFTQ